MHQLVMPGEQSDKFCVMSDSTYWDVNTIHVHIPLHHLMHRLTVNFDIGGTNFALRYITSGNGSSLLQGLSSLICMVQVNRRTIVRVLGFINSVAVIINKKLCCVD